MASVNANAIRPGTRRGDRTLTDKRRVLANGDTRWDLFWDDGSVDRDVPGQNVFYGVRTPEKGE